MDGEKSRWHFKPSWSASTKIGSQPPATKPAACHLPSLPPQHRASGKTPTSQGPAQQARIPDQRHPCCCWLLLAIDPSKSCQSLVHFPLLPSRCDDNNPDAPLRCLALDPSNTFASTPTALLRAPRNAVTITSKTPSQHANETSRHAHHSPRHQRLDQKKQAAPPRPPPPPIGTRPPPNNVHRGPIQPPRSLDHGSLLPRTWHSFLDISPRHD